MYKNLPLRYPRLISAPYLVNQVFPYPHDLEPLLFKVLRPVFVADRGYLARIQPDASVRLKVLREPLEVCLLAGLHLHH